LPLAPAEAGAQQTPDLRLGVLTGWIPAFAGMSGIRALIQAALRRASIVRSSVSARQRLCIGAARGRSDRRGRNGGGGAGSGSGSSGRRRAGWCTGHRAGIGRHVLSLLVSDELLVSRRAGPRRHVLGHAAGPGRPGIGDKSGERTARPERQADAKRCRQREQALGRAGRQIRTSMLSAINLQHHLHDNPPGRDHLIRPGKIILKRPPAAKEKRLHGGTVSAEGLAARQPGRFYPLCLLVSRGHQRFANGRFVAPDVVSA
jgi:hypothetical protein